MSRKREESLAVLGLRLTASDDDIRKAYRQKARELHPDKNQNDPNATERFQKLQEAYRFLINEEEEEEVVIVFGGIDSVILRFLIEIERQRRMQNQFGVFPCGHPRPFDRPSFFQHVDDDDDNFIHHPVYENSSRNFHTGSSSTGRRTTRFSAAEQDGIESENENIPKPKESHANHKQNETKQKPKKKKSRGNWNTTKKKKKNKNQRNAQWGRMSSNSNNGGKAAQEESKSQQHDSTNKYESCHEFQEPSKDKKATEPLPNEEEGPQKIGACKTSKQKTTNTTEQNFKDKSTVHEKNPDDDEVNIPASTIQTEKLNSSSSFTMKSTQEPSKEEENIQEHEVSSEINIQEEVHADLPQYSPVTQAAATNSKGVDESSSETRNIEQPDNDDVGVELSNTCPTKSTSPLHQKNSTDQETVSDSVSLQTPTSCPSSTALIDGQKQPEGDVNNCAKQSKKKKTRKKKQKTQNETRSQIKDFMEKADTMKNASTVDNQISDGDTEPSHTTKTETKSTTRDSVVGITRETETPKSNTEATAEQANTKLRPAQKVPSPQNTMDVPSKNLPSTTTDETGAQATNNVQNDDWQFPVTGQQNSQHSQEHQQTKGSVAASLWSETPKKDNDGKNESKGQKLPIEEQHTGVNGGSYSFQEHAPYQEKWYEMISKPKGNGNKQRTNWKSSAQDQQHLVDSDVGSQFQKRPKYQEKPFESVDIPKESNASDWKFPVQEQQHHGDAGGYQSQKHPQYQQKPSDKVSKPTESSNARTGSEESLHCQNPFVSYNGIAEQSVGADTHGYYASLGVQEQQHIPQPSPRQKQHIPQPSPRQQHIPQPSPRQQQHIPQPSPRQQQHIPQPSPPPPQQQVPQPSPPPQQLPLHQQYAREPTTKRVLQPQHHKQQQQQQRGQQQSVQLQRHFQNPKLQRQQQIKVNESVNHFQASAQDYTSSFAAPNTAHKENSSKVDSELDYKSIREQLERYLDHQIDHSVVDTHMKLISLAKGDPTV